MKNGERLELYQSTESQVYENQVYKAPWFNDSESQIYPQRKWILPSIMCKLSGFLLVINQLGTGGMLCLLVLS